MNPVLQCQGLSKRYHKNAPPALSNVSLELPAGQIIGLLGPNGSGKTTLLKLAGGLLSPTQGQILINGTAPGVATKARVSYMPEKDYLPNWMRAHDLLAYFANFYADFDTARAQDMLSRLGIDAKTPLKNMSKGTREKVQLILVMSRNADLYLLDEPIGGVDPAAREYILDTIIRNYRPEASVILSTHLIADIEKILDTVIFISGGQVNFVSTVDDIRQTRGMSVDALFREVYRC